MNTFDKYMMGLIAFMFTCLTSLLLVYLHNGHIEKMADKQIEIAKIEKMCIDE